MARASKLLAKHQAMKDITKNPHVLKIVWKDGAQYGASWGFVFGSVLTAIVAVVIYWVSMH